MSRMVPGRTDHVCVRHYKMLTKGPPRQKHARAVRQRSGRFVAWEKVNSAKLLTALPEAEVLQIESTPALAGVAGDESIFPSAPASAGGKPRKARKAKRAKRKAQMSSSDEKQELEPECMRNALHQSEGEGIGAGQRESIEAGGLDLGQEDPLFGTMHPQCQSSRPSRSSKVAGEFNGPGTAGADLNGASDEHTDPGNRQQVNTPSQGKRNRRPRANAQDTSIVQAVASKHAKKQGPQHDEEMPGVGTRISGRKRRVK